MRIINPYRNIGVITPNSWDIDNLTLNQDLLITETGNTPKGIYFKPDGTEMYFNMDTISYIYQYSLSTAWDITTATYTGKIALAYANFKGSISLSTDGTKAYHINLSYSRIRMMTLSTAWDITTAVYTNQFLNADIEAGLYFKNDGTSFFCTDRGSDLVTRWDCSTAWDITTATANGSLNVSTNDGTPIDLSFKPDGSKMYLVGITNDQIFEYSLSIAWDITTATLDKTFNIGSIDNSAQGIFIKEDGSKMYITGNQYTKIFEFDWT